MFKKNILSHAFLLIIICMPNINNGMWILLKAQRGLMVGSYAFYAMKFGCYILQQPSVKKKLPKMLRVKNKETKKAKITKTENDTYFRKYMIELFSPKKRNFFLASLNAYKKRLGEESAQRAEKNLFTLALIPLLPENGKNVFVYS